MHTELLVPLTDEQYEELAQAEQAKAEIEQKKSVALRFLLLAHAARERVDAAIKAGVIEIRRLESGAFVLVLPGDEARSDADTKG